MYNAMYRIYRHLQSFWYYVLGSDCVCVCAGGWQWQYSELTRQDNFPEVPAQHFCFQTRVKYFFTYFDPESIFLANENKYFAGDLTDISAKK